MLDKSTPKDLTIGEIHVLARKRLTDRHANLMEKIVKENCHKDKYWILGTVKCKRKKGRTTISPLLRVYDVQPEVQKDCYLYEINNIDRTSQLLWVMHPNNKLSMPVLQKTISVAG